MLDNPDNWVDCVVNILLATSQAPSREVIFNSIVRVHLLDKKLHRKALQEGSNFSLKFPLQLIVQMTSVAAKVEATQSLTSLFRKESAKFKLYRVSRFIPPTLRAEHSQIKRIMNEATKDSRAARFTIIPVFDQMVGYTLKVLFSPDINTQPQLKEHTVQWERPYPTSSWKPST